MRKLKPRKLITAQSAKVKDRVQSWLLPRIMVVKEEDLTNFKLYWPVKVSEALVYTIVGFFGRNSMFCHNFLMKFCS